MFVEKKPPICLHSLCFGGVKASVHDGFFGCDDYGSPPLTNSVSINYKTAESLGLPDA